MPHKIIAVKWFELRQVLYFSFIRLAKACAVILYAIRIIGFIYLLQCYGYPLLTTYFPKHNGHNLCFMSRFAFIVVYRVHAIDTMRLGVRIDIKIWLSLTVAFDTIHRLCPSNNETGVSMNRSKIDGVIRFNESAVIDLDRRPDKKYDVFADTTFLYDNPYNIGWWHQAIIWVNFDLPSVKSCVTWDNIPGKCPRNQALHI